ncbi:MAG: FAD-dependent oxidoreductase [Cyanobacteria bacterium J06607_6]
MAVDYDLVILGGTPEGLDAAAQAARLGARVALIRQGLDGRRSPLLMQGLLQTNPNDPLSPPTDSPLSPWQWAVQRAILIADTLTQDDWQQLMVQGVDVIAASGQIIGDRPLNLTTPARQLTTRALLLATGHTPSVPDLPGLSAVAYDTPQTCLQRDTLPASVIIWDSAPLGLALAQNLRRWGVAVTLVTPKPRLLPAADPEISQWLAAQLRAEGIDLRLNADLLDVTAQPEGITVKLTDAPITAASLVVATQPVANLMELGLKAVFQGDRPLTVNAFLQTEHPRIYACGAVLGGDDLPAIARQEAHCALHNALFWNRQRIDYSTIPYALPTQPTVAQVGLTEPQARQRYSDSQLLVARQSLNQNPKAQWRATTGGFCKLLARRNGQLIGAHGIGPEATEWIQTVALLMAQKTPWWRLTNFSALPDSFTEILRQATQQWERDRWQPGGWRYDWAENWSNWRRSR